MFTTVFLGGTCGNSLWRENDVIPVLTQCGVDPDLLFNPVVQNWDAAAQEREDRIKRDPMTLQVYVIASPQLPTSEVSAYSLVEAVMALYDTPQRVVVAFDTSMMSDEAAWAHTKIYRDLKERFPTALIFPDLTTLVGYLADILPASQP